MWVTASPRAKRTVLFCWIAFALLNLVAMWRFPAGETIPFHFVWISIALVFGVNSWPLAGMLTALGAVTASTGLLMLDQAARREIRFEETAEVPLMAAVFLVMVWHVRGRQRALEELQRVAALEKQRAETQELFVRLGSHELRTSITVARGYVELIRSAHEDQQTDEDAGIVLDELGKLDRMTGGLTTLMRLDSPLSTADTDLDAFLERLVRRWTPVADRRWSVESGVGTVLANTKRLQAALDSLLENAITFTQNGDRIAVRAWRAPRDSTSRSPTPAAASPPRTCRTSSNSHGPRAPATPAAAAAWAWRSSARPSRPAVAGSRSSAPPEPARPSR